MKAVLPPEKIEDLNQKLIEEQYNIITCVKCNEKFEFV